MPIDCHTVRAGRARMRFAATILTAIALAILGLLAATSAASAADSAVILMYQRIGEPGRADNISAADFDAHLAELANPRYHVMRLEDLIAAFTSGTALPDRTVVITFDDAYRSVYDIAVPKLAARGFPYTVFVSTDAVDERRDGMMSWGQIQVVAEKGADIGNHGARPLHMVEMSAEANRENISRAAARIAEEVGTPPTVFAYPYGEFANAARKLVAMMGYAGAVGQFSGVAAADQPVYALPRFVFTDAYAGIDRFRTIVNALPFPVADVLPDNPKLTANPPSLGFTLTSKIAGAEAMACVPSFGGNADVEHLGDRVEVRFDKPFPKGNGRVTCTATTSDNRVRWLGVPVYVPKN